jgi:similar to stage IV sporulation protein
MLIQLLNYFTGTAQVAVGEQYAIEAIRVILEQKLIHGEISRGDDGIRFTIRSTRLKQWKEAALHSGIEYEIKNENGFPKLFERYKGRWGIAVGAAMFAAITLWSSAVIWNVDVTGNSSISDSDIIAWLEEQGCSPGTYIKSIDFDSLHNNVMLSHPELAWVSVNMDGTWAHVEVREVTSLPKVPTEGEYTNVVSGEDGQIELVYVYEGKSVVQPGDAVRKGELIISGAVSVGDSGVRFERGSGKVQARVQRSFEVEIPFDCEKKQPTGRSESLKSIIFFGKRINLFINSGISYANYDTIEYKYQVKFFGRFVVPVWICVTKYSECETAAVRLSEAQTRELAEAEYTKKLAEAVGDGELLACDRTDASDESCIRYICRLTCSDDIGVVVPITVKNDVADETETQDTSSEKNN